MSNFGHLNQNFKAVNGSDSHLSFTVVEVTIATLLASGNNHALEAAGILAFSQQKFNSANENGGKVKPIQIPWQILAKMRGLKKLTKATGTGCKQNKTLFSSKKKVV